MPACGVCLIFPWAALSKLPSLNNLDFLVFMNCREQLIEAICKTVWASFFIKNIL